MANYLKQSESNIHEKGEFMNNGLVESWICSYLRLQGCKWASLYLFLPDNQISRWWFCGYICPVMVVWVPRVHPELPNQMLTSSPQRLVPIFTRSDTISRREEDEFLKHFNHGRARRETWRVRSPTWETTAYKGKVGLIQRAWKIKLHPPNKAMRRLVFLDN